MPAVAELNRSITPAIDAYTIQPSEIVTIPGGTKIRATSLVKRTHTMHFSSAIKDAFGESAQSNHGLLDGIVAILDVHNSLNPDHKINFYVVRRRSKSEGKIAYHIAKRDYSTFVELLQAHSDYLNELMPFRITPAEHQNLLAGDEEEKDRIRQKFARYGHQVLQKYGHREFTEEELLRILDPILEHPNFWGKVFQATPPVNAGSQVIAYFRISAIRKINDLKEKENNHVLAQEPYPMLGNTLKDFFTNYPLYTQRAQRLLGTLEPELQIAFIRRCIQNVSTTELCSQMKTNENTIRSRFTKARDQLEKIVLLPSSEWPGYDGNGVILVLFRNYAERFGAEIEKWDLEERIYLEMKFMKGWSNEVISNELGIPVVHCQRLASRIRKRITLKAVALGIIERDQVPKGF